MLAIQAPTKSWAAFYSHHKVSTQDPDANVKTDPPETKTDMSNNDTSTALVEEPDPTSGRQALLARFKEVLGLKAFVTGDEYKAYVYGQRLEPLNPSKPTGTTRRGNVLVVSLDLIVKRQDGKLMEITWAARSFDTAVLDNASPEEYTEKLQQSHKFGGSWSSTGATPLRALQCITLGGIRRAISDVFEPLCRDYCTNGVHQDDYIDFEQTGPDSREICNHRRAQCDDAAHDDENNYDHTRHHTCKPRRDVVLLLSDKEKCLQELRALGCDPQKFTNIVDIVGAEELYQVYLVQADYGRRHPMTGGSRTILQHDWAATSTLDQVLSNLGYESAVTGGKREARNQRTLLQLKVAVDLAVRDALSPDWARTRWQIVSSVFHRPWPKFRSDDDIAKFLVEYDAARGHADTVAALTQRADTLVAALSLMSKSSRNAYIGQLARIHKYEHLLDLTSRERQQSSRVAATNRATSVAEQSCSPSPSSASSSPSSTTSSARSNSSTATSVPKSWADLERSKQAVATARDSAASSKEPKTLSFGEEMDEEHRNLVSQYHEDQKLLVKHLNRVPVADKKKFDKLFNWVHTLKDGCMTKSPVSCDSYSRVLEIVRQTEGDVVTQAIKDSLRAAISKREQVAKWHERLHPNDPRREQDNGHRAFLEILRKGERLLLQSSSTP